MQTITEPIESSKAVGYTPTVGPARYAKGMVAVQCPSDGSGFKTRAARLADALARRRYSNRERAWIMSPARCRRLLKLYADGWDCNVMDYSLEPPQDKVTQAGSDIPGMEAVEWLDVDGVVVGRGFARKAVTA